METLIAPTPFNDSFSDELGSEVCAQNLVPPIEGQALRIQRLHGSRLMVENVSPRVDVVQVAGLGFRAYRRFVEDMVQNSRFVRCDAWVYELTQTIT